MKARGVRWEGEREAAFSLFPSSPARILFFDHCFFSLGYPARASAEEVATYIPMDSPYTCLRQTLGQ